LFILASRSSDPTSILFEAPSSTSVSVDSNASQYFGFYWTEGNRGLGWSPESIPPLKGGSSFSIPSPPAIWDSKNSSFFTPGITDAERLQGFQAGWSAIDPTDPSNERARWRLVGNAVSVPVVQWIGNRIVAAENLGASAWKWDHAGASRRRNAGVGGPAELPSYGLLGEGPRDHITSSLQSFPLLDHRSLSQRAGRGFLSRIKKSPLKVLPQFVADLETYVS
jgi:DNA (cytosine-5)-methyltransferase 1